jgi:hypothetical protein
MLFLGHLVIGLIIGFILYEIFHDRMIIVFVAIGSVLPDVIDKPLGYIIFSSTLDDGKIFFHGFIIVLLFFLTGLLVWKWYKSYSFIFLAFGVFLHQIVDMMWKHPVNWYFPLLGPYPVEPHSDYFLNAIVAELSSVTEWIFFAAILVVALVIYRNHTLHNTFLDPDPRMQQKMRKFTSGLVAVALFVLAIAIIIIAIWDPVF